MKGIGNHVFISEGGVITFGKIKQGKYLKKDFSKYLPADAGFFICCEIIC